MRTKATKGECTYCGKEYTRAGMAKHLVKCVIDKVHAIKRGKTKLCFHLQISAKFTSAYWLHVQVDADADLNALDNFLRKIWLECCGHMSMFHIDRREMGMSRKLSSFLAPGMEIDYEYDMGDTTSLVIKVVNAYDGLVAHRKPVEILARNQPPHIQCGVCGKNPAAHICPFCQWDNEGWLCNGCIEEHECEDGEDYSMPVVNSPRAGVCGYVG